VSHPWERFCPKCGSAPRTPCMGRRGDRKSMHRERWFGQNFRPQASEDDAATESPIEKKMLQAIKGWLDFHEITRVKVKPQAAIGPYRADILIDDRRREVRRRLIVECDGREFHGSETQIDRDRRRDRWFAANDIFVMRFSGSEIHRDARGCAAQVGEWVGA
jgi:very-short-patch-repair endonuclease